MPVSSAKDIPAPGIEAVLRMVPLVDSKAAAQINTFHISKAHNCLPVFLGIYYSRNDQVVQFIINQKIKRRTADVM